MASSIRVENPGMEQQDPTQSISPERRAQLIAQVAEGDPEALAILFTDYAPVLASRAKKLANPQDAPDILQEAFIDALRQSGHFEDRGKGFNTWLYKITQGTAVDYQRKTKRQPLPVDNESIIYLAGEQPTSETLESRVIALNGLAYAYNYLMDYDTSRQRYKNQLADAFLHIYIRGMSPREYAELRHCSINTITARVTRIHKLLQELAKNGEL